MNLQKVQTESLGHCVANGLQWSYEFGHHEKTHLLDMGPGNANSACWANEIIFNIDNTVKPV